MVSMRIFSSRFNLILLISLVFTGLSFVNEAQAQWGGQGSGIPGLQGMRRGASRNANNPDGPSSTSQQTRVNQPVPGSHLLTYEQIESRLSELEQGLKPSNDQMKAWSNFANKVRLYASDVAKERARLNADSPPIIDGLKYLGQASNDAKDRYTSLKEIDDAAKPLYKNLSIEQKILFDNKISSFVATTPKRLGANQPSYNLPDFGASPPPNNGQGSGSNSLPGYIHQ